MAKFDYVAMNDSHVSETDERAANRTVTQEWLSEPSNVELLLEVVSCGKSLRRYCETSGLSYSAVQRALTSDGLRDRYYDAQEQQAEHLLGEMERISAGIEDGTIDAKAGAVILSNLQWRISKFNARRYSDKQVIEQHTFDHTQAHIEAVRQLARQPRRPAIEGRATEVLPLLSHEAQPRAMIGTVAGIHMAGPDPVMVSSRRE